MCILYSPTQFLLRKQTLVCAAQLLHVWLFESLKQGWFSNNLYIWRLYIFGCQKLTETCNVWTDLCCVMTPGLDCSFRQSSSLQHFLCFLLSTRAQKCTFTTFSRRTDECFQGKMATLSERRQAVKTVFNAHVHIWYTRSIKWNIQSKYQADLRWERWKASTIHILYLWSKQSGEIKVNNEKSGGF